MSYIIANWKMQLGLQESIDLMNKLADNFPTQNKAKTVICPSYISLTEISKIIKEKNIPLELGAQNVFWEEKGAYTGEISCNMLKEVGCRYVIIGHSDRRHYFQETDEMIHYKIKTALHCSLVPILCVGETFKQRQEGKKDYTIISQITKALSGLDLKGNEKIIVAYEPVWVIGSGQAVSVEEAVYMNEVIRQTLLDIFSFTMTEKVFKVIYGGSIDKDIVKTFLVQKNIEGVLVGGASLKADGFLKIIEEANKI